MLFPVSSDQSVLYMYKIDIILICMVHVNIVRILSEMHTKLHNLIPFRSRDSSVYSNVQTKELHFMCAPQYML